jgi:hypothetical protein
MKDEEKKLFYLYELSDYKVADDYADVRDWQVLDSEAKAIGIVDGLLVSKEAERVVYLDIEVDSSLIEEGHQTYGKRTTEGVHEFLNEHGDTHLIIPIGLVTLDESQSTVLCNGINYSTFVNAKRFKKGKDLNRSFELLVLPDYEINTLTDEENVSNDSFYDRREFIPTSKRER